MECMLLGEVLFMKLDVRWLCKAAGLQARRRPKGSCSRDLEFVRTFVPGTTPFTATFLETSGISVTSDVRRWHEGPIWKVRVWVLRFRT